MGLESQLVEGVHDGVVCDTLNRLVLKLGIISRLCIREFKVVLRHLVTKHFCLLVRFRYLLMLAEASLLFTLNFLAMITHRETADCGSTISFFSWLTLHSLTTLCFVYWLIKIVLMNTSWHSRQLEWVFLALTLLRRCTIKLLLYTLRVVLLCSALHIFECFLWNIANLYVRWVQEILHLSDLLLINLTLLVWDVFTHLLSIVWRFINRLENVVFWGLFGK